MTTLQDFYDYITENYEKTRYEVTKNITYDEELFNDAYNDTVVKVAKAITERHKDIEDIRYYFFISCKQNYIQMQNKRRKEAAMLQSGIDTIDIIDDDGYSEERYNRVKELFDYVCERLEETFEPAIVDIYVIYYKLKSSGEGISYRKMADITGLDIREITTTIQTVKKWIRSNAEIMDKKKELNL